MKKKYNILFVLLGIILPIFSILLVDFIYVKGQVVIPDVVAWLLFAVLCFPFLARGIYGITGNKVFTVLLTIVWALCIAAISVLILLNFHFLIGGSK